MDVAQVHLGSTRSVVVTGQLVDADGGDVAQSGVEVTVGLTRTVWARAGAADDAPADANDDSSAVTYENTDEATRTTNDDGTVTFVVDAPRNIKNDKNQDVVDVVTFTVEADGETANVANTMGSVSFNWVEDTRVYQKTTVSATEYVLVEGTNIDNHDVSISVSARLFDQYGNGIRVDENGNAYRITLTLAQEGHETDINAVQTGIQRGPVVKTPTISSSSSRRGMARALFAVNNIEAGTHSLTVAYAIADAAVDGDGELIDDVNDVAEEPVTLGVQIRYEAVATNPTGMTDVTYVYVAALNNLDNVTVTVDQTFGDDDDTPATHFATLGAPDAGGDEAHGVLYAVDDNDTYIVNGETAADCVTIRPEVDDMVRIVIYYEDADKSSIFDITPPPVSDNG